MFTEAPGWLNVLVAQVNGLQVTGKVSQYLPELAAANDAEFGVALCLEGGQKYSVGSEHKFTVQSVVKVITLLIAVHENGLEHTLNRVGRRQSSFAYDSLHNFDASERISSNPFCNVGAFIALDIVVNQTSGSPVDRVLDCARYLTRNPRLSINMKTAQSEYARSSVNRSIIEHLDSYKVLTTELDSLLWTYCQICSIEMDVEDLANFAWHLALDDRLRNSILHVKNDELQAIQQLLLVAGMYEESASYAFSVGVPTKCGISGSVLGVLPGVGGVGIYSPSLNGAGNSVRGIEMMRLLTRQLSHLKLQHSQGNLI